MPKKKTTPAAGNTKPEINQAIPAEDRNLTDKDSRNNTGADFHIVGIGASAGGLAAFETFFRAIPAETRPDMAFILVQHLAPDYKSILSELIKNYTRMDIFEVTDGMTVMPGCVYVIPPNYDMALLNGTLHLLTPATPHGHRLPIDFFLKSLAQDKRERAICIILSGTGTDGTLGAREVKGEGGMVMVQTPESTEYNGMPHSAIATGVVDYILPPEEMPARLIAYGYHAYGTARSPGYNPPVIDDNSLKKLLILLRTQTGHDFSMYKPSTIYRRIERRMALQLITTIDEYLKYAQQTPTELLALFHDLLIGVTKFFRDPELFEKFENLIIPRLFSGLRDDMTLRIWVPGCSTGEEAYSIAILLSEYSKAAGKKTKVQIFSTDINSRSITYAREGRYPSSIASDISTERLERYFTREPDSGIYAIRKEIRDMMIFSEQNLIKDPPFSKLDLISCRNLLIYMNGEIQKKLIPTFHYILNPGGYLFLGSSETVGEASNLFETIDTGAKLYQKKDHSNKIHPISGNSFFPPAPDLDSIQFLSEKEAAGKKSLLREVTERTLLLQYAAVGVLVNELGDILFIHGRAGLYLEPVEGEAGTSNIFKMARYGLRRGLINALRKAVTDRKQIQVSGLRVKTNGRITPVQMTIRPISALPESSGRRAEEKSPLKRAHDTGMFLVILERMPAADKSTGKTGEKHPLNNHIDQTEDLLPLIDALKQELQVKEEYLQSVNEELETSREEMQAVNEELSTVNTELQIKVADLSRVNNDMNNLMAGTGIATIFVDHDLRILRFTSSVSMIMNLISTDVGRPIDHFVSNLKNYTSLTKDLRSVLESLISREIEVQTHIGEWYMMRIQPYYTLSKVIEGAVITFTNITEIKKSEKLIQESENLRLLAAVVHDSNDAVSMQDMQGRILAWNPAAERIYGWTESEALKINTLDRMPEKNRDNELITIQRLGLSETMKPHMTQRLTKDGRMLDVWLTATALIDETRGMYAVVTTERPAGHKNEEETE